MIWQRTWSDNDGPPVDLWGRRRYHLQRFFNSTPTATAEKLQVGDRKKLGRRRREVVASRPPSPVVHAREYVRPSWLTSRGVTKKRRLIEKKGLPSFKNWRFITLTVCRKKHPCPLAAYLHGVEHLRRFFQKCYRKKLWKKDVRWAWKLEFQADGYPHWHMLVEHRQKLTVKQLGQINDFWAMGRTEVQRVEKSAFGYSFKYAFKPVMMEADPADPDEFERFAPDWFLDYVGRKTVKVDMPDGTIAEVEKPVTFRRVRFWQTSRGFYTGRAKKSETKDREQETWTVPLTARECLNADNRTVMICGRDGCGQYISSCVVSLSIPLEGFWALVGFDCMHAGAVGLGVNSFVIPTHRIQTDKRTTWQLQQVLRHNYLTLRQAAKLQAKGTTLRHC